MKPFQHFLLCGALAMIAASAQAQQRAPSEAATAEQRLAEDLGLERLPRGSAAIWSSLPDRFQRDLSLFAQTDQQQPFRRY